LLEKDRETLKWGKIYHIFKKSNLSTEAEDPDELQVFRNIRKSSKFGVATHPKIFPYADAIIWILKNTNVNNRYFYDPRRYPIASYIPKYLAKCYHIEKGINMLDKKILSEFEYMPKDLFPKWYREEKKFKYIPKI
jgi:hypothetical protein